MTRTISDDAVRRLSGAIQIPTLSMLNYADTDFSAFDTFLQFLQDAFPLLHATLEREQVNTYGLVYIWRGTRPEREPILLMAHYDVVPAEDLAGEWKYPPFSGTVAEGRVWGRGTLDIKSQLIAHMEAVETLIRAGFTPERDIYFAYGHDEEISSGTNGATIIAALFKQRGLRFAGILDEGGLVVTGAIKGVRSPVALIGVSEKGHCNYEITVRGSGGHSSMPPKKTALGQAAELVTRIERHPLPARLTPTVLTMLQRVSVEMGGLTRFALQNTWLLGGLVKSLLANSAETNAMLRTTCAPTMARASDAENVLPQTATVNINVRLLAGDTIDSVAAHFRKLAGDMPVEIRPLSRTEASPVSPSSGEFYEQIEKLTQKWFPDAIVVPYLVMGGTDSRKYADSSDHIYRFTPIQVTNEEKNAIHNRDESISIENYAGMVHFFEALLESF
ncbi:MAG: M20/M25/M40 family metallo-hydrolase [Propionibacteriaceae bacterium]|jgi:carboxypeptidase PM20D1|nr:M20/M25/M40 family metallo-hydrolase [Propionibacteriaceae bacterium]